MVSAPPPRQPPRFVPTLTEVVHTPQALPTPVPPVAPVQRVGVVEPPRRTLASAPATAPVAPVVPPAPSALRSAPVPAAAGHVAPQALLALEEQLVHRVLQRVDLGLEPRLSAAIAEVVREQTRALLPRLREEIQTVVRQAVHEAVSQELDPAAGLAAPAQRRLD